MKPLLIKCPTCEGRGDKPLSRPYIDVLRVLTSGQKLISHQIADRVGIEPSVAMMRLSRLTAWGFLKRTGSRREYTYSRK